MGESAGECERRGREPDDVHHVVEERGLPEDAQRRPARARAAHARFEAEEAGQAEAHQAACVNEQNCKVEVHGLIATLDDATRLTQGAGRNRGFG